MSRLFPGGIHPREGVNGKAVNSKNAVIELPAPARVVIPLSQHAGKPAAALVKKGDAVKVGQKIGEAQGTISACVHSSVSGKVFAVTTCTLPSGNVVPAVAIDNDDQYEWAELKPAAHPENLSAAELAAILRECGVTGMGGAQFPTAVKLSIPEGKSVDTLIINGTECEPYLCADDHLMADQPADVVDGVRLVMLALNIKTAIVGIEANKPAAIKAMTEACGKTDGITVKALPVRYPQGGEKQLIYALTRRKVPTGGLPADIGVVVLNVSTCRAISDAVRKGEPPIHRVTTVGGLVNKPGNFLVRIGTPIADVIEAAGGLQAGAVKVLCGGPMMGSAMMDLTAPVTKGTSGITVLGKESELQEEGPCIRCGRCVRACPMQLMPAKIDSARRHGNIEAMQKAGAMNCMECGACTYACPAHRPLTQSCRTGKAMIRTAMAKKAAEEKKEV